MKILLTNDDGYDAPNLKNFYKNLSKSHEVWIVAPKNNCSGMSAAISYLESIGLDKIRSYESTLTKYLFEKLENISEKISNGILKNIEETNTKAIVNRIGSMMTLFFTDKNEINNYLDKEIIFV